MSVREEVMRLGVVSDTHGHVANTLAAVRLLESFEVAEVLHCGDIGSTDIVPLFARWPTHFVLGNVDGEAPGLAEAIERAGQPFHGRFGSLELAGRRIAWLHSDDQRRFRETVAGGQWDLVCYGHTHVAEHHREGPTLVLNPGALFRARTHTIAVVELPALEVTLVSV
jgi:putative phosphoesterase